MNVEIYERLSVQSGGSRFKYIIRTEVGCGNLSASTLHKYTSIQTLVDVMRDYKTKGKSLNDSIPNHAEISAKYFVPEDILNMPIGSFVDVDRILSTKH